MCRIMIALLLAAVRRRSMVRVCSGVLACGVLALAQTAEFEVASVKPAPPDARGIRCTGGPGTSDPGSLTCENYSLSFLVMMAYNLRSFQLTAPAWMDTARYNVVAKIPPGTDTRQFGLMQQRLLVERFGLQVHFEKKDMTVYELTVAKGGSKLTESQDAAAEKPEAAWRPPAGGPPVRTMARVKVWCRHRFS